MSDSLEGSPLWTKTVQQEEERLRKLHPALDDIPTCMSLFDELISCAAVGRQFRSLYRYGEMAHCSHKWSEWKSCISSKSLHPEQRREDWIRRRAEWWARRRLGASSENVWDVRGDPPVDYPKTISTDQLPATIID